MTGGSGLAFEGLDPTEFEEFCFDLLRELGFVNVDWRKGTALEATPADQGRDIEAQLLRTEIDESTHFETWFVDCKHYEKGVPPSALQGLLAWAEAERPDVALVIASGFLSNPSKEHLKKYEQNRRPPFRIRYWERPKLERLTDGRDELLRKFLVAEPGLRTQSEILEAEQEFYDRIWHNRKVAYVARGGNPKDGLSPEVLARVEAAMREIEDRYGGEDAVTPEDDFEWGMWSGKLSALRWVLGDEWDMLDT